METEHEGNLIVEKRREETSPLSWESCEENEKVSKIKFITLKIAEG